MRIRFALPIGELLIIVVLIAAVLLGAVVWQITTPGNNPPVYYGTDMIVQGSELYTKDGVKIADWVATDDGQAGRWKMLTPQQIYDQQQK